MVPRMNLEKLKVSSWKSCLYRLIKLKTPFRSSRSQSKHLHEWLPKVAELFINTFSEQDVAKSHDNDVLIVDSPSAILKMEKAGRQTEIYCACAVVFPPCPQRQQHDGSNGRRNNSQLLVPSLPARLFILSEICHVPSRPQTYWLTDWLTHKIASDYGVCRA